MRLIDADALIEKFNEKCDMETALVDEKTAKRFHTFCILADAVEDMPTIEAEPVRHGHWDGFRHNAFCGFDDIGEPIFRERIVWYCSNRKCRRKTVIKENYCPKCGAKMDEVE